MTSSSAETTFETAVYKFLNYSTNSMFYATIGIGLFIASMLGVQVFKLDPYLKTNGETFQILFILLIGTIIGIVMWRWRSNKHESKEAISNLGSFLGDTDDDNSRNKLLAEVNKYKNTSLEILRRIRTLASLAGLLYLVLLALELAAISASPKPHYIDGATVLYGVMFLIGATISAITTFFINVKFSKGLTTLEKPTVSS